MSKTFFDMNSKDTLSRWTAWDYWWDRPGRHKPEWPPWLTCPEHYKVKVETGIDWGKEKDYSYVIFYGETPGMSEPIDQKIRDAHLNVPDNPRATAIITGISDPDCFTLSVRDTNNLVRYLYTGGWISHEEHPEIHKMLDEMIAFLEARGIKVDMNMQRM